MGQRLMTGRRAVAAIMVLYHADCTDGFGAAWAAWKALGDHATYVPARYGEPLPALGAASRVYLLDISYSRAVLDRLAADRELQVIDHHRTAAVALAGCAYATFDMGHAACVLTWQHFHATPPPALLRYVEDRDLWRWALPQSREVSAALWASPMDFAAWDSLQVEQLAAEGGPILRFMARETALLADQASPRRIAGYEVPTVNATGLASEVGEELLRRYPAAPFVASYADTGRGYRKWSLRSRGAFDVSAVAQQLGGGGHRNAAGFEEPTVPVPPGDRDGDLPDVLNGPEG
jgi:uncharacterized protein